jgi:hypothetical protein
MIGARLFDRISKHVKAANEISRAAIPESVPHLTREQLDKIVFGAVGAAMVTLLTELDAAGVLELRDENGPPIPEDKPRGPLS